MSSRFVRTHARRAERIDLPPPAPRPSFFRRQVPAPPAPYRFRAPWASPATGFGPPDPPAEALDDAPMDRAFYLGRVDELPPGADRTTSTLWEWPSGRALSTVLSIEEHFDGERLAEGQRIRVWTWMEYPGDGERRPRLLIEVDAPPTDAPTIGDG